MILGTTEEGHVSGKMASKMSFCADIFCDAGILAISSANDKFNVEFLDPGKKTAKVFESV